MKEKSGPGYCENCGERVYKLGCVNCDEEAYIEEQRHWDEPALSMEEALLAEGYLRARKEKRK